MTKINDYLWQLPHVDQPDDPPDIGMLQQTFNRPIVETLSPTLKDMGYELKSNDVMVRLDSQLDAAAYDEQATLKDTYIANVRFISYIGPDVLTRVHFEHGEWAHFLPTSDTHTFFVNLDRFKVQDLRTQIAVPAWHGRLHTRMSGLPGSGLHHNGEDQIWTFSTSDELIDCLNLFLRKFEELGRLWLEDSSSM